MGSYSFCALRLLGDLAIILAFPILIARIFARGVAGVSVTTQGLHLLVFLTRYIDLFTSGGIFGPAHGFQWFYSWYNPTIKAYLIISAFAVLATIAYKTAKDRCAERRTLGTESRCSCIEGKQLFLSFVKTFAVYTIPCFFLAYRFHLGEYSWTYWFFGLSNPYSSELVSTTTTTSHGLFDLFNGLLEFFSPVDLYKMSSSELLEVAWSFSIFLSAVADIPQYVTYYNYLTGKESLDWWLMGNMLAVVTWRFLYIPHWILRFIEEQWLDPITFACAVVQVFAFWMFFILAINKVNNIATDNAMDEEAQWEEYEARWGTPEREAFLPREAEKDVPNVPVIVIFEATRD